MYGFCEMMVTPVVMAIILVAMHGYLGTHVVRRSVIFVDIALAQIAAFGVAVAMFFGAEVGTGTAFWVGLGSTFFGAILLSCTRSRNKGVPQEAYIGIVYVVFSAGMILVLSQVAHGGEGIQNLLVGAILWVTWGTVLQTAIIYGVLAALLFWWHKSFQHISVDPEAAHRQGLSLRLWDFLFYMVLGTVVTISVQIAGVLMVFTILVVPSVMAMRIIDSARRQLIYVMLIGIIAVVCGSTVSYVYDLPTGATIVCAFGGLLVIQILTEPCLAAFARK
jgi:zinc/manganese transport system permease protein